MDDFDPDNLPEGLRKLQITVQVEDDELNVALVYTKDRVREANGQFLGYALDSAMDQVKKALAERGYLDGGS